MTAIDETSTDADETGSARPESRGLSLLLAIGGAIGLIAATVLTHDKMELLKNPDFVPNCNVNAFVSCSGVMESDQASAFGFANSLIGMAGFSIVMTLGVVLLTGARLPAWIWTGLQAGVIFGIGFVTWLQFQSLYEIQKLCPYCMVVWAVMIPLFVYVTVRNLRALAPDSAVSRFLSDWTLLITLLWYVAIIAAIWFKFGESLWA